MADVVAILYVADVIATVIFSYSRCYCHSFVADVIAMFLLADVIAIVCVLFWLVADVLATVAVVFATCGDVVSFYGRCCCHLVG